MRLEKIEIANFGVLTDYKLMFEDNLTVVYAENGKGKSTLLDFITAMFYGVGGNNKDLAKSMRSKYRPWNGGTFGGAIEFSIGKNSYRIEREFGKTAKDDNFNLYDKNTNRKSKDFSTDIGLEIFGVGEDSFVRTIYAKQSDLAVEGITGDVDKVLRQNVATVFDESKYTTSEARLKTAKSAVNKNIKFLDNEISMVRSQIADHINYVNSIETYRKELENVNDEITEVKYLIAGNDEKLQRAQNLDNITKHRMTIEKHALLYVSISF